MLDGTVQRVLQHKIQGDVGVKGAPKQRGVQGTGLLVQSRRQLGHHEDL